MELTRRFWGDQGRVGVAAAGPWEGRYVFAYPDTSPEWWTVVVSPSPHTGIPGDEYFDGNNVLQELNDHWQIEWLPLDVAEAAIEREYFGWRPLRGAARWLP